MKRRTTIYCILLLILTGICIYINSCHKDYEHYITIFATASSIIGVIISIFEVLNVRKTTEAVSVSLNETKKEINDFLNFSEINEMTRLIDEIEAYINNNHVESAWLKLKELKGNLDKQSEYINKICLNSDYPSRLKNHRIHLGMDIRNIYTTINNHSIPFDSSVVIKHLDETKECLHEMSGTIKTKRI